MQVAAAITAITAKACEDGGLTNIGCLTLQIQDDDALDVSKNDLKLKALVLSCRRKITTEEPHSRVIFLVELGFFNMYVCVYDTSKTRSK